VASRFFSSVPKSSGSSQVFDADDFHGVAYQVGAAALALGPRGVVKVL
jgi:hypothetical protein